MECLIKPKSMRKLETIVIILIIGLTYTFLTTVFLVELKPSPTYAGLESPVLNEIAGHTSSIENSINTDTNFDILNSDVIRIGSIHTTQSLDSPHQKLSITDLVTANFSGSPTEGITPLTVIFTNTSSEGYSSSLWDFGTGITSTIKNPTHTYSLPGSYTVTLEISGLDSSDKLTRSNYISVHRASNVFLPIVKYEFDWDRFTEWTPWSFQNENIQEIEVGPKPGQVWSITGDGLYLSMNYGLHWKKTDFPVSYPYGLLAIDDSIVPEGAIYVSYMWEDRIYVSYDTGETWALDVDLNQNLGYLGFAGDAVYAASYYSPYMVWERQPTGEWVVIGNQLDGRINDIAMYQSMLYVATSAGLYRLNGDIWELVNVSSYMGTQMDPTDWIPQNLISQSQLHITKLSSSVNVQSILVYNGTIFIGTSGPRGLYKSSDGVIWTACDVGITGPYSVSIHKILASKTGRLFATARTDGVFTSDDQGNRWQALDTGLPHTNTGYGVLLNNIAATSLAIIRDEDGKQTLGAAFNNQGIWFHTVTTDTLLHDLPSLDPPKAVLVIGPIDPPQHNTTKSYIAWADRLANIMEQNGMNVVKIYWPDSTWENVRDAISGASIVVYKGHGFGIGDIPDDPTEMYGGLNGFCLVNPEDADGARLGTQDMLISTNRLADNAIAFFFCCYCAGYSSSGTSMVPEALARKRIEGYSSTVLRMGGVGYFSGTNEESILEDFFAHPDMSLGDLYKSYGGNPQHVYSHILWPDQSIWFDGDAQHYWNRAFVGNPNLTANDVLGR